MEDDSAHAMPRRRACTQDIVTVIGHEDNPGQASAFARASAMIADSVFFKPVDGGMNHYTLMGERPSNYEILIQLFEVKVAEFDARSDSLTSVTVCPQGQPRMCNLSTLPFDALSKSLMVWGDATSEYHVSATMFLS